MLFSALFLIFIELEEAAILGIAPPIAKSSLQVSVKGLKKRLARSQSISGDIFTTFSIPYESFNLFSQYDEVV